MIEGTCKFCDRRQKWMNSKKNKRKRSVKGIFSTEEIAAGGDEDVYLAEFLRTHEGAIMDALLENLPVQKKIYVLIKSFP